MTDNIKTQIDFKLSKPITMAKGGQMEDCYEITMFEPTFKHREEIGKIATEANKDVVIHAALENNYDLPKGIEGSNMSNIFTAFNDILLKGCGKIKDTDINLNQSMLDTVSVTDMKKMWDLFQFFFSSKED